MRLHAIYRTDTPPGPAASWLIARFEAQPAATADCGHSKLHPVHDTRPAEKISDLCRHG